MDAQLYRELQAIGRDRSSGAAELGLRAIIALRRWTHRRRNIRRDDLLAAARAMLAAQPAMATLLRIANELALADDETHLDTGLQHSLAKLFITARTGPARIARQFPSALRPGTRNILVTHSYSSTVLEAIVSARSRIWRVICSEGRPVMEGRKTARGILGRGRGIRASLSTDAALPLFIANSHALVVGADSLGEAGFTNKVGTAALVSYALKANRPVWVLADTSKLLPRAMEALRRDSNGPESEIWPDAPKGLSLLNPYFELTRYESRMRILTEKGWMTPGRIRAELKAIKVSPLLEALATTVH